MSDQVTSKNTDAFQLNIPHSNSLVENHQHQQQVARQHLLDEQKQLIENHFSQLSEGQTTVAFDTNRPLLPEVAAELSQKGYNYYYDYSYSSEQPEPKCHVVITSDPRQLPPVNSQLADQLTNDIYNSFRRLDSIMSRSYRYQPMLFW
jgi:hypothetical protein